MRSTARGTLLGSDRVVPAVRCRAGIYRCHALALPSARREPPVPAANARRPYLEHNDNADRGAGGTERTAPCTVRLSAPLPPAAAHETRTRNVRHSAPPAPAAARAALTRSPRTTGAGGSGAQSAYAFSLRHRRRRRRRTKRLTRSPRRLPPLSARRAPPAGSRTFGF